MEYFSVNLSIIIIVQIHHKKSMPFWERKQLDIQKYNEHFYENSTSAKIGPIQDEHRSCTDICCLVIFIMICLAGLIIGAMMINDGRQLNNTINYGNNIIVNMAELTHVFKNYAGIVIGMFCFSLIIAVIFLFLIHKFPRCMIYTMIILIFLVYAALIVFGALYHIWWMVIVFSITLVVNAIVLKCFWGLIQRGILLLQLTTTMLTQKPSVYLSPIYPLIFGIIFFVFWLYALVGELSYLNELEHEKQYDPTITTKKSTAFLTVWIIYFIFMIQFLYYVQTFLIGTCCANWFYRINRNYFTSGAFTMNRYHLGSLTFGALVITILNVLKRLAREESQREASHGNSCMSICCCLISCCLSCIEDLIKTLNHNAVIVMTVTGQNYINSAKTALSIILQNFGLFYVVNFISQLVSIFGVLLSVGIPTLTGFLLIHYSKDAANQTASYGAVTIFFLSIMISGIIVSMIGQTLSCIFIFYCFNQKFKKMGIIIPNSPPVFQQFHHYQNTGQQLYTIRNPRIGTQQQLRRNL